MLTGRWAYNLGCKRPFFRYVSKNVWQKRQDMSNKSLTSEVWKRDECVTQVQTKWGDQRENQYVPWIRIVWLQHNFEKHLWATQNEQHCLTWHDIVVTSQPFLIWVIIQLLKWTSNSCVTTYLKQLCLKFRSYVTPWRDSLSGHMHKQQSFW